MGSLDNQTTKQVLAVDTNCQNFTGKEKNQGNVNLGPQSVPRKQTPSMGEKREKRKKGKKLKISRKKGKKNMLYPQCPWCFLQLGAGSWPGEQVFFPSHTWRASPGQCHPGQWHPGQCHHGQCHPPASLPLVLCLELLCSVPRTTEFIITLERFKSSLGAHG